MNYSSHLKVKEIFHTRLELVLNSFAGYIDGIYLSNTPNYLFESYGNVDYFADIVQTIKKLDYDLKIAVDVWDTEWSINALTGFMTDSTGLYIHPIDMVMVFRSNYEDWYQDCSALEEGAFCSNQMLNINMVDELENAVAKRLIKPEQLVTWILNANLDQYEKMFRNAHQSLSSKGIQMNLKCMVDMRYFLANQR